MFFVIQRAFINEYSEGIALWFPSITLTGYLYLLSTLCMHDNTISAARP